jgi:hypothetical protein
MQWHHSSDGFLRSTTSPFSTLIPPLTDDPENAYGTVALR